MTRPQVVRKPLIVPIFIPQEGCPHRCVYCDQKIIADQDGQESWTPGSIRDHVKNYLGHSSRRPVEVAFYGGTFTLLPRARQALLLESVQGFVEQGLVESLRLSTRPDALDSDILDFLKSMGVKTIELGAQSLNDRVLTASGRGHTARDLELAALRVRAYGLRLGLQLMPGLPGDNRETFLLTVEKTIALQPDSVRLYPTVVLAGTPLARLYRLGRYRPLSVVEAVEWCKEAQLRFSRAGIPVIRTGLQASSSLEEPGQVLAGPYHPAFGQLVKTAIWYERISPALAKAGLGWRRVAIHAAPQEAGDIRGHGNANIKRWLTELGLESLTIVGSSRTRAGKFRITPQ